MCHQCVWLKTQLQQGLSKWPADFASVLGDYWEETGEKNSSCFCSLSPCKFYSTTNDCKFFLLKWLFDSSLRAVPPHCSFESKYNLLPTQETWLKKKKTKNKLCKYFFSEVQSCETWFKRFYWLQRNCLDWLHGCCNFFLVWIFLVLDSWFQLS